MIQHPCKDTFSTVNKAGYFYAITLVLQLQQVLGRQVENLQPPEVVVLLQIQEQQLEAEVELQEQILQQILDLGFDPLHHHHLLLALRHPLQSRDQQLASEQ